jgi:hypothetical protein
MKITLGPGWIVTILKDIPLRHVSASAVGHLQLAHKFSDVCSLCVNLCRRDSTYIIKIITNIQILKIS